MERTRALLATACIAVLLAFGAPVTAAAEPPIKTMPTPHVYDVCKQATKTLGYEVPCETRASDPVSICWLSKKYSATHYYFRLYTDGAWTPWRMYYTTLKPVPARVC